MAKPSWVTCSPSSGTGSKSVNVTATRNDVSSSRSGSFSIKTTSGITKTVSVSQEGAETHTATISGSYRVTFSGFSGSRLRYLFLTIAETNAGVGAVTLYNDSTLSHLTNATFSFNVNTKVTWVGNDIPIYRFGKISWQMDPASDTTGNRCTSNTGGDFRFSTSLSNNVWSSLSTVWTADTSGASVSGTFTLYKS